MQLKWLTMTLAMGLCLAPTAYASPPDQTGAFVSYCANRKNHESCHKQMAYIEIADQWEHKPGICVPPEGINLENANDKILGWLDSHPGYGNQPLHDGMQAAMKGLWQCATKLNNGLTSSEVPDTAGRFSAFCDDRENYKKCSEQIVTDFLVVTMTCTIEEKVTGQEVTDKALAWLQAHPQPAAASTDTSVETAVRALWPCH